MNAAKNSKLAGFSDAKFAFDSAGLPVDCSGQVWILNCASRSKKIDWKTFPVKSDGILAASQQFMRHMIESQSPASVRNAFSALTLLFRSSEFQSADAGDTTLQYVMFSELKANLGKQVYRLHYIRQWYGWCSNFGYPNFSPDVAFEADQMQFGGNDKGQAVLSADPDEGPLSDAELSSLLTAMRATLGNDKLSLHQQAALWLCVALGPNPMQMAMLTEEDFIEIPDGNELGFMHLQVPRIKKRDNEARSGFRVRSLTADIGQIVKALIFPERWGTLDQRPCRAS